MKKNEEERKMRKAKYEDIGRLKQERKKER